MAIWRGKPWVAVLAGVVLLVVGLLRVTLDDDGYNRGWGMVVGGILVVLVGGFRWVRAAAGSGSP